MGLETTTTISGMNPDWPLGTDPRSEGDNHIRILKSVLQARFDDSVNGFLQLKNRWVVALYNGTTRRADIVAGTAATGQVQLASRNNAGTTDATVDFQPGSFNSRSDGLHELAVTNLAGSVYRWRMQWDNATGIVTHFAYAPSGALGGNVLFDGVSWSTTNRVIQYNSSKAANEISHYNWYAPDAGIRFYVGPTGNYVIQRVNAAVNNFIDYASVAPNGFDPTWTFPFDVWSQRGAYLTNTVSKGFMAAAAGGYGVFAGTAVDGWGTGAGPLNNVEIASWWGVGFKAYDGGVRYSINTRNGETMQMGQATIGSCIHYTDGNILFAAGMLSVGDHLHMALTNRSSWNNQTAMNTTGYPIGTTLMMYTNGVQVARNSLTNPCFSNNDNIYYRLQGQPNAGTRLDGNWRACGHVDSNWVQVQRVP